MKTKTAIWLILIASVVSFFVGRQTVTKDEIVRYVTGETVYGRLDLDFLTVKQEFKTDIGFLPYRFWKADTVKISEVEYVHMTPDSAKIFEEFMKRKEYEFTVRDNELGKFIAKPVVQYNSLVRFDWEETPIQKVITRNKEKVFTPFISGSYNTFDILGLGGGMFYHNIGVEYKYLYQFPTNEKGHEVGVKWKF